MEMAASRGVIYSVFLVLGFCAVHGAADENFRLPNGTIPMHYILRVDTAIDQNIFNYTGNVQISVVILHPTTQLVLHSTRNNISQIQLRDQDGRQVQIKNFKLDNLREFLVIEAATLLYSRHGTYTLEIDFTNSVDRFDLTGFYKVSYQTGNDAVRYIGVTHFSPINARSAFPCFDEPNLKATFDLHVSCGRTYHVRSNTPARTVLPLPNGNRLYSFTTTPRMSTYLVAWFVSDYVSESKVLTEWPTVTVTTWANPSSSHLLSYSVDASVRFLRAMRQYFAQPYGLPKIDNIVVPQFNLLPEAMENWGLVTYRGNALYVNPQTDGVKQKRAVAHIIAHEYTHQIFGNLLTPARWSYLWLAEGFAHFYSYYLGSISHPEHNFRKRFLTESLQLTFYLDSFASVQQMTRYVETRNDIVGMYSSVVYSKAGCVIRMMNYALGERIFRRGIRGYIQRNKKQGIVTEYDLFESLELAARKEEALPKHLTMHEVFRTWSHQAGYPVVRVRREGNQYFFTQQRYLSDPAYRPTANGSWWIPISFATANNTTYEKLPAFWMAPNVSEVSHTIQTSAGDVVVFNPQSTGLYRVEYDGSLLRGIIDQLSNNHTAIDPTARARLIDDTLQLTLNRGGNFSTVLQLLSYLRDEADILPWSVVRENVRYMQSMLRADVKTSRLLQSFVETIVAPLLSRHDLHPSAPLNGSDSIDELRSIAIELACGASESCQKASKAILQHTAYRAFLFQLSDSVRPKELHRLIVGSKVSPRVLLASIGSELSLRGRQSTDPNTICKTLIAIARFAMEPSEEMLLISVASTYFSWVVPEIEQQLMINRRWRDRNVQPLTDALSRFSLRKA
ncbi:glutamyl aminopeptidase-like [Anopheles moucheti]|uniref:glutamyl aminopeptidase-like n=1 Tax=Anopheles moucheti TaxID=186751 RepID=UPI0022F020F5|nr:glutamyl aminopeptidase-like [Anopheles moucheti]